MTADPAKARTFESTINGEKVTVRPTVVPKHGHGLLAPPVKGEQRTKGPQSIEARISRAIRRRAAKVVDHAAGGLTDAKRDASTYSELVDSLVKVAKVAIEDSHRLAAAQVDDDGEIITKVTVINL